ncbi:Ppx/GppA phosphatase family-domain-containing protein [Peziza echinospora]|nr:Ppx/GppA phosphatase family-domain-containing protein [Peziza echinospora]
MATEVPVNEHYRGLVDIGSNGVRFSITDLAPASARIMPTIFQDRAPISLYDAQFIGTTKAPISHKVIHQLTTCMVRFKHVCSQFGVPPANVRVVATEATREAQNSLEFRAEIETATGWKVELLSKEDEGRIGAEGVASSFVEVNGLVMDLGGGSTQLTWMISTDGNTQMPKQAVSFPYGAAAVTKRLETAIDAKARSQFRDQVISDFKGAAEKLAFPASLLEEDNDDTSGYKLYLSGGGFRGFGYLLMERSEISPYPIPIINGFTAPASLFKKVAQNFKDPNSSGPLSISSLHDDVLSTPFGISSRRARQVPAVAFVVEALMTAIPNIHTVIFCQGGVREGAIYESLPQEIRSKHPLLIATAPFAPRSQKAILTLLNNAVPRSAPYHIRTSLLPAMADLLTYHSSVPRESQASVALYTTTTGCLASTHGVSHALRALVALSLCDRWGGEVHASAAILRNGFQKIVGVRDIFWAKYVGLVAALIGSLFPAGVVPEKKLVSFFALDQKRNDKKNGGKKHGGGDTGLKEGEDDKISLKISIRKGVPATQTAMWHKAVEKVEKVGKRKTGLTWRKKVVVTVVEELDDDL